ncbi:MAG: hypothetical protein ACRD3J_27930 [Thermoanaerobaculia bacterium]
MEDPIIEETREARRQLDSEFGGDLHRLYAYLREIEDENGERVVKLDPKPLVAGQRKVS